MYFLFNFVFFILKFNLTDHFDLIVEFSLLDSIVISYRPLILMAFRIQSITFRNLGIFNPFFIISCLALGFLLFLSKLSSIFLFLSTLLRVFLIKLPLFQLLAICLNFFIKVALNNSSDKDDKEIMRRSLYLLKKTLILWPNTRKKFDTIKTIVNTLKSSNSGAVSQAA